MPRLSHWSVEAYLLSDELAKELAKGVTGTDPRKIVDGHSAEEREDGMSLYVEATEGKPQLSVGTHTLRCTNVEDDEVESLRDPSIWRFTFECEDELDPNGNPVEIDGITSRYLTPNSKAWAWCEALGMKLVVGERHNLEEAIGGKALGKIVHKASANGAKFARLNELMALPKGNGSSAKSDDALTEAQALAAWMDGIRSVGYTSKEIIDHCKATFDGKTPDKLTADERDKLAEELKG